MRARGSGGRVVLLMRGIVGKARGVSVFLTFHDTRQVLVGLEKLGFKVTVQSSEDVDTDFCTMIYAKDVCLSEGGWVG